MGLAHKDIIVIKIYIIKSKKCIKQEIARKEKIIKV